MVRAGSWMGCLAAAFAITLASSGRAGAEEEHTRRTPVQRFEACELLILEDNEYVQYVENQQSEYLAGRKEHGASPQRLKEIKARFAETNARLKLYILEKSEVCRIRYAEDKQRAKARAANCKARVAARREALAVKKEEEKALLAELKEEGKSKERIEAVKAHYGERLEELAARIAARNEACAALGSGEAAAA